MVVRLQLNGGENSGILLDCWIITFYCISQKARKEDVLNAWGNEYTNSHMCNIITT